MRQAPGTLNARAGGASGVGIVLRNGRSHTASALNHQADDFRLQNVLAPRIHVLYLEPIDPYRLELRMPDLHNPYIEWNPRYQMFSIFHNGGIHAYNDATPHRQPLMFDTYAAAGAYLADPTGLFDGHIDGGMHDGCPCKACAFCRDNEAGK